MEKFWSFLSFITQNVESYLAEKKPTVITFVVLAPFLTFILNTFSENALQK